MCLYRTWFNNEQVHRSVYIMNFSLLLLTEYKHSCRVHVFSSLFLKCPFSYRLLLPCFSKRKTPTFLSAFLGGITWVVAYLWQGSENSGEATSACYCQHKSRWNMLIQVIFRKNKTKTKKHSNVKIVMVMMRMRMRRILVTKTVMLIVMIICGS